jgi:molybdate transport system substrate-binding protein
MRALSIAIVAFGLATALPMGFPAAAEVRVAVAANFTAAAKEIATAFKVATGDDAILSFGSSGQLLTQITQEAPFEVFLSADQARPEKLVADGFAVPDSRFTYAVGRLVLWSAGAIDVSAGEDVLRANGFSKIAIANPLAAPYGTAARQTLEALGLTDAIQPRIVEGTSIAQTLQFIETGNAELGFVALSQLVGIDGGTRWLVPEPLYRPILQDAVLLEKGAGNAAAAAFLAFLKGDEARAIIEKYGYAVDGDG